PPLSEIYTLSLHDALPIFTVSATLSYGHALTQFRHRVQSMFEVMVGTNRSVSQPGKRPSPFGFTIRSSGMKAVSAPATAALPECRPCRHGFSTQLRHTSGSTAVI